MDMHLGQGRQEVRTEFWLDNFLEKGHLEDSEAEWQITLRQILTE
jgi:hypothetical protein